MIILESQYLREKSADCISIEKSRKKKLPEKYIFVKTCNREELYYDDNTKIVFPFSYSLTNHIFRLASGLESPIVGENQILNQIKTSYKESIEQDKITGDLHYLFQKALNIGKTVRTKTGITKGAVSYSQGVVEFLNYKKIDITNSNIALIGVNNMNINIIKYLIKKGLKTILIGNRTIKKAQSIALKYSCSAFKLDKLKDILKTTDILITATSAPHYIVNYKDVPVDKKMIIIDLAEPKDVDSSILTMDNKQIYTLNDIEEFVNTNIKNRINEIKNAEEIIKTGIEKFFDNYKKRL